MADTHAAYYVKVSLYTVGFYGTMTPDLFESTFSWMDPHQAVLPGRQRILKS